MTASQPSSFNPSATIRVIYTRHYNISFLGIERLHPFDARKFGRAWSLLREQFGARLSEHHISVDRPVSDAELLLAHSREYIQSLRSSECIATALEVPLLRLLPGWLLAWRVLRPMRWAARGSVIAAKAALQHGAAVNLSGGYHHAKPSHGEGFCVFSDIGLIVHQLRHENLLKPDDRVVYVDLDAHQGNGVCHEFMTDREVLIFDMYNQDTYPAGDAVARRRIDVNIPLSHGTSGADYLATLHERLPAFLNSLTKARPRLAIYNAGTDVFAGDQLGGLALSADDILSRDLFVIQQFRRHQIPFVMLLSGGYSPQSYRLVANTVAKLLRDDESSVSGNLNSMRK